LIANQIRCGAPFALNEYDLNHHTEYLDLRLSLMRVHFRLGWSFHLFPFTASGGGTAKKVMVPLGSVQLGALSEARLGRLFLLRWLGFLLSSLGFCGTTFGQNGNGYAQDLIWFKLSPGSRQVFSMKLHYHVLLYHYSASLRLCLSVLIPSRFWTSSVVA
jgi:hypothetical protein